MARTNQTFAEQAQAHELCLGAIWCKRPRTCSVEVAPCCLKCHPNTEDSPFSRRPFDLQTPLPQHQQRDTASLPGAPRAHKAASLCHVGRTGGRAHVLRDAAAQPHRRTVVPQAHPHQPGAQAAARLRGAAQQRHHSRAAAEGAAGARACRGMPWWIRRRRERAPGELRTAR